MKTINEKFTETEYSELKDIKMTEGLNWHDFLIKSARVLRSGSAGQII